MERNIEIGPELHNSAPNFAPKSAANSRKSLIASMNLLRGQGLLENQGNKTLPQDLQVQNGPQKVLRKIHNRVHARQNPRFHPVLPKA